ncbi:MAG: cobalt ECF transporter T component CbiQ [Desulfobacteraceae bacterium]|nr:cobalt ECF transporter T component CbiQ [Desulfobacteraceae bacterium]
MSGQGFSLRIDYMIQEYLERSSPHGFHTVDPRLKLALLVTAVAVNVYFARLWLSVTLLVISLFLILWSRIPLRLFLFFFLAPAWATLIVFAGFSIGFGTTPIYGLGPFNVYREGIVLGISAAARVASDMSWMATYFLTTPFPVVLKVLKWYRIPDILVDTLSMTYRYAFLLMDEYYRMRNAARGRGGFRTYRSMIMGTSMIIAQIILRAYDRSERIQKSMVARGENTRGEDEMNDNSAGEAGGQVLVEPDILNCRNLSFSYMLQGEKVITDFSLAIKKGDIVCLCGPNGSGKTTILKLFCGILPLSGGELFLLGHALTRKNRNEAFRYVGILFQDPNDQLFSSTVREDIAYGPTNLGLDQDEIDRRVDEAMKSTEIEHLAQRPIHRLSFGEMKRVGLAGLIAMKPPLILLDEPAAFMDPASVRQMIKIIRDLNENKGFTFVIVTHDINVAARVASRMVILNHGAVQADGFPKDILADETLLNESRLEPPILTKLFKKLKPDSLNNHEIPITTDEAVKKLLIR